MWALRLRGLGVLCVRPGSRLGFLIRTVVLFLPTWLTCPCPGRVPAAFRQVSTAGQGRSAPSTRLVLLWTHHLFIHASSVANFQWHRWGWVVGTETVYLRTWNSLLSGSLQRTFVGQALLYENYVNPSLWFPSFPSICRKVEGARLLTDITEPLVPGSLSLSIYFMRKWTIFKSLLNIFVALTAYNPVRFYSFTVCETLHKLLLQFSASFSVSHF